MANYQLYDHWWSKENENEQVMEENHQRHWRKVLEKICETDLKKKTILDFGCNQGGFLRFLYHQRPFKSGIGVDLAQKSIDVANERKGILPLNYYAAVNLDAFENQIDLAISTSVIYLIEDLSHHARQIKKALKTGGVYYASYTDYSDNPSYDHMKKEIDAHANCKFQDHSLDMIAAAFGNEGFEVGICRITPNGFIPAWSDTYDPFFKSLKDRIKYEYEQAFLFRFELE